MIPKLQATPAQMAERWLWLDEGGKRDNNINNRSGQPSEPGKRTLGSIGFCVITVLTVIRGFWVFFFFSSFFGHACSMGKFAGEGLNPHHSSDQRSCSDYAGSLTTAPRGKS